jgi:predicted GIY-YIG superfamily endonuclease
MENEILLTSEAVAREAVAREAVAREAGTGEAGTGEEKWVFYLIHNKGCTYAGVSPDPIKRLRKHNKEIAGGAKYTLSKGSGWEHICLVSGFQTKIQSMQFEWAVKHIPPRDAGGLVSRIRKLYVTLNKPYWTSKSPRADSVPLEIKWIMDVDKIFKGDRTLPSYVREMK